MNHLVECHPYIVCTYAARGLVAETNLRTVEVKITFLSRRRRHRYRAFIDYQEQHSITTQDFLLLIDFYWTRKYSQLLFCTFF